MKHVAAYLLAVLGGKANPTASDIEAILDSGILQPAQIASLSNAVSVLVGVSADSDKLSQLLKELEGKDIHEVICAGREKMSSVPAGGGVAVAVGGGGGAAAGGEAAAAEEKEEEPEEEEEDEDMGFSLFD